MVVVLILRAGAAANRTALKVYAALPPVCLQSKPVADSLVMFSALPDQLSALLFIGWEYDTQAKSFHNNISIFAVRGILPNTPLSLIYYLLSVSPVPTQDVRRCQGKEATHWWAMGRPVASTLRRCNPSRSGGGSTRRGDACRARARTGGGVEHREFREALGCQLEVWLCSRRVIWGLRGSVARCGISEDTSFLLLAAKGRVLKTVFCFGSIGRQPLKYLKYLTRQQYSYDGTTTVFNSSSTVVVLTAAAVVCNIATVVRASHRDKQDT